MVDEPPRPGAAGSATGAFAGGAGAGALGAGTGEEGEGGVAAGTGLLVSAGAGAGIPADVLPRIFDRFYKGPASTGSGLGLTIARNFVEAHGGQISAESRVGEGTVITFTLPRAAA